MQRHSQRNWMPGQTVGIDLGTAYSAIAQLDDKGNPVVIPNAQNHSLTPSVVLLGDDGHVIVGPTFERLSIENPERIVVAIKRQIGNEDFQIDYQGRKLTPEFISALIVKKLIQDAETRVGRIANAVFTVPCYFNDVRRKATIDAGRIAGLNVIDTIQEPIAAALAYAWVWGDLGQADSGQREKTVLVCKLGGGTFDVAVVRYSPTHFHVLATDGDVMLGGMEWTQRLVDQISEQFLQKFGHDPRKDLETRRAFTQECEDAKRQLSTRVKVPISLYSKGKTLTVSLTRSDFERMTADLLQRARDTIELALMQAKISVDQLDEVALVGGSTYMPMVEQMLKEVCNRQPSSDLRVDAVAKGVAIHAAILETKESDGSRFTNAVIRRLKSFGDIMNEN